MADSLVGAAEQLGGWPVVELRGREAVLDLRDAEPTLQLVADRAPTGQLAASAWQLAIKRGIDIVGSLVLLALLFPLMLTVALLVRLTSEGPALFMQERIGRDGRPFKMVKFRSMYRDAHQQRPEHADLNEQSGPMFKIRNDPRTTSIGRVIRRLSIDELPQLINVLRGEMSLVGPRPPLPEEYEQFSERERRRMAVTPGLTCVWQVSGRSDLEFDRWVDMDLEYIHTWNLRLDLKLLAMTLPAVVLGRGAY